MCVYLTAKQNFVRDNSVFILLIVKYQTNHAWVYGLFHTESCCTKVVFVVYRLCNDRYKYILQLKAVLHQPFTCEQVNYRQSPRLTFQ